MCPPDMRNVYGIHVSITYGKPLNKGTFTNRDDPDAKIEKPLRAALHQGLLFVMVKKSSRYKNTIFLEKVYLTPINIYNGLSQVNNCFKPEVKIH